MNNIKENTFETSKEVRQFLLLQSGTFFGVLL